MLGLDLLWHTYLGHAYQVHDELIFEVSVAHAPRLRALVRRGMQEAAQLRVPLFVKVQQGPSWGELRELED